MAGGLIQMNAHMEVTAAAASMIALGIIATAVCVFVVICGVMMEEPRLALAFVVIGLLGVALVVVGARMPRDRIITACASGPVSLEQVAAVYDVIEVDGKMLRLRER